MNSHRCHPLINDIRFSQVLLSTNESISLHPRKRRKTGEVKSVQDFASELQEATQAATSLEHMYLRLLS
jgi:hypothetical protein